MNYGSYSNGAVKVVDGSYDPIITSPVSSHLVWTNKLTAVFGRRISYLVTAGMAADYLPRVSSHDCHYPFTYLGSLYHGCVENMENVTSPCERWGCYQINYTAAVCAANIGQLNIISRKAHNALLVATMSSGNSAGCNLLSSPVLFCGSYCVLVSTYVCLLLLF